ncbi:MAG: hypothetical protein DRI36_03900 [Caldiserica bacterium]|nr:MAG: hypothetical protein DRI36_03900 [Caldisericota bacterium]
MRRLSFLLCLIFVFSCAKRGISPLEEARLEAQEAINNAESKIEELKSIGGDITEPQSLLDEAKKLFEEGKYKEAKEKAIKAYNVASKLYDEIIEARKKLEEMAKKEEKSKLPTTYTVGTWEKDRDCLWNISKKKYIYNDPWKWKRIYQANKNKIKNPDLIYPGQVLKIPR